MHETFPDKGVGEKLSAPHLNRLSESSRRTGAYTRGSYIAGRENQVAPAAPFSQEQIVVTSVEDSAEGHYRVRPRFFDSDTGEWVTDDAAGPFDLDTKDLGLSLVVGDTLVAFWHSQRGRFIPVSIKGTAAGTLIKTPGGGINGRVNDAPGKATCAVYKIDSGDLLVDTLTTLEVYNVSNIAVAGSTFGVAARERETGKWIIVMESCG